MSSHDSPNYRTPLGLVIKTLTTHAFALASYAYVCSLLRRPTWNNIQVVRLLFFAFVPTVPLVELIISAVRGLIQFVRNYEDDEEIHLWYYFSGALGVHAALPNPEDTKDRSHNLPLLLLGSHYVERTRDKIDWAWFGKLIAALFSLTQAVGTIVMYARRLDHAEASCFGFDHRTGAMGIASAICNVVSLIILLMRFSWNVSPTYRAPDIGYSSSQKSQFAAVAVFSLMAHLTIATFANSRNIMLYTSVGSVAWLVTSSKEGIFSGWQTVMLLVFLYVFRKEIGEKLGFDSTRLQKFAASRKWKRVKALLGFCLLVWILVDIIWLFVADIVEVVRETSDTSYYGYWWQDPISDSIVVI